MTSPGNFEGVLYHETFQGVRCRVLLLGGMTACPVCFEVGSNAEACNSVVLCSKFFHYQSLYFISFTLIYSFPWFLLRCARRTFFFREVPYFVDSNLKSLSQNCKNLFNRSIARATLSICIAFPALKEMRKK